MQPPSVRSRPLRWLVAVAAPLALAALFAARPGVDVRWEHHPAHFWLVLLAALAGIALGLAVSEAARRRSDARLLLVSYAFVSAAGFLGLHALATPGVLVGPNAGFEMATPVGLLAGGAFAAASGLDLRPGTAARVVGAAHAGWYALAAAFAAWAAVSLLELPPLDSPLGAEQLDGWQRTFAIPGVLPYATAAALYLRLFARRGARFVFAVTLAFALLAEAMIVIAVAANWRASWWEWHVLMLAGFAFVAIAAKREWHEERFSALYLDETLAGARDVSVLFADLEGFTTFSERTAQAEVAEMLNAYWSRLVPLLEARFRAEVHQLMGDAVMAVWNKDGRTPGHARLAADAALAFQQEAAAIARAHPAWPRFRAAVNSGDVLVGVLGASSGKRQHGVVGDAINLAARLEGEAAAGQVVIGAETHERLGAGAIVERLGPLRVKGKDVPVEAFVLHRLGPETS